MLKDSKSKAHKKQHADEKKNQPRIESHKATSNRNSFWLWHQASQKKLPLENGVTESMVQSETNKAYVKHYTQPGGGLFESAEVEQLRKESISHFTTLYLDTIHKFPIERSQSLPSEYKEFSLKLKN